MTAHGMEASMSPRADRRDNAVIESFFATLKLELAHKTDWATLDEARTALF
jgi:putative transposase